MCGVCVQRAQVWEGWGSGWAGVGEGVGTWARVCECVWDEFSEFLPENRVPTSAVFNTKVRISFALKLGILIT